MRHYLTNEIKTCQCINCGNYQDPDEYDQFFCEKCSGEKCEPKAFIPSFWAVAIYERETRYGGPEEGGWNYSFFRMIKVEKLRCFENMKEAKLYLEGLRKDIKEGILSHPYDEPIIAMGFSEMFPFRHYPNCKPSYS